MIFITEHKWEENQDIQKQGKLYLENTAAQAAQYYIGKWSAFLKPQSSRWKANLKASVTI